MKTKFCFTNVDFLLILSPAPSSSLQLRCKCVFPLANIDLMMFNVFEYNFKRVHKVRLALTLKYCIVNNLTKRKTCSLYLLLLLFYIHKKKFFPPVINLILLLWELSRIPLYCHNCVEILVIFLNSAFFLNLYF